MDYVIKKMNNYNIYFVKTTKFKTVRVSFCFMNETFREDEVYRGILRRILINGTSKYPNLDDLCKAGMKIYDPSVNISLSDAGLDRRICLDTVFVNDKYTESGMNEKSIEFALERLYFPKVFGDAFDKETFELARHDYIESLRNIKNDTKRYCNARAWNEMEVFPYKEFSIEESIEFACSLDEKDLYEYYLKLFCDNSLDVFVCGDVDEQEFISIIDSKIKGNFKKHYEIRSLSRHASELKVVKEKVCAEQSKLAIGLRYEDLTEFEYKYVSLAYNNILGGSWNSKLNKVVREKNSLCYYIYANRIVSFGVSFVYSGINSFNYDKTVSLIREQLLNMENNVTEEELCLVKDVFNNALISIEDKQSTILNNVMASVYNGADSIDDRRTNMAKVTVNDVMAFAKKVKLELIYLLEGGDGDGKEDF